MRVTVDVGAEPEMTYRSDGGTPFAVRPGARGNLLLEGSHVDTHVMLEALLPCLQAPVIRRGLADGARVDPPQNGTLVLEDVDRLTADQQAALQVWLESEADGVRVVATATVALFSLVVQGRFDAALYYRLNTVLLRASR